MTLEELSDIIQGLVSGSVDVDDVLPELWGFIDELQKRDMTSSRISLDSRSMDIVSSLKARTIVTRMEISDFELSRSGTFSGPSKEGEIRGRLLHKMADYWLASGAAPPVIAIRAAPGAAMEDTGKTVFEMRAAIVSGEEIEKLGMPVYMAGVDVARPGAPDFSAFTASALGRSPLGPYAEYLAKAGARAIDKDILGMIPPF